MPRLKNDRHEAFAVEYAVTQHGTKSALAAGVSAASAATAAVRLLKRADVRKRIAELKRDVTDRTLMRVSADRSWVLQQLVENAEDAKEARDRAARNRALELIGKELGMFVDRRMDVKSPLDELSAAELRDLLDRIRAGSPLLDVTPTRADDSAIADSSTRTVDFIELSATTHLETVPAAPEQGEMGADDVV